jgi:hypothetical protein
MVFFRPGSDKVIKNHGFWSSQNIDVPENSAGTKLILILQIAAVTPFQDQNSKMIRALLQVIGDIKFAGRVGDLTVAYIGSVEPQIKAGIYPLKI